MKLNRYRSGICLVLLCFFQTACGPRDLAVFKDCDECPEMVNIPAGKFMMGISPFSNIDFSSSQKPQHVVQIQAFAIGKFEVTQEQYYSIMGINPSKFKGRTMPVDSISWDDAQTFVEKLSKKTGRRYRLPSESEWEYAARAGSTSDFFWGDDFKLVDQYAWYLSNSDKQPHPVGLKKPNRFGLYDMAGNLSEWVADSWSKDYTDAPTNGVARKTSDSRTDHVRIIRGSSYAGFHDSLSTASRDWTSKNDDNNEYGIRIARDLP